MKYIAIIPARKGSKEIPNKNIRFLAGKPLICWTIEQAIESKMISKVFVSTDCKKIAKLSKDSGAEVPFIRPHKYSKDNSTTESVLLHFIEKMKLSEEDNVCLLLLQPTSPIRFNDSIDKAIIKFEKENADSLVSVNKTKNFYWKYDKKASPLYSIKKRPMRQKLKSSDIIFKENGSIYITKLHILLKEKNRLGGRISIFEMKEEEGHEIDSFNDFNLVKSLIFKLKEFKKKIFISNVSAIVFDFDGVLTNNKVYVSERGEETVRCDKADGHTFELLKKLGLKIFILSSEKNHVVKMRAKKLNIDLIYGSENKKNDLQKLCKKNSLDLKKLVYVGNDINDLEAMKVSGFSIAVADAVKEIKNVADFVLDSKGGDMVVREIFNNLIER